MSTDRELLEVLAYHEAGHAVVAWKLQVALGTIGIHSKHGSARDMLRCRERNPEFMSDCDWKCVEKEAQILVGGEMAEQALRIERELDPDADPFMNQDDQRDLTDLVAHLFGDDSQRASEWINIAKERADKTVIAHWTKVSALANVLVARRELSGDEATRIIREE